MCDATWTSDFSDCFYGIKACCDQPAEHDSDHAGPVIYWDGPYEELQKGVRLSWPQGGADHELGGR